MRAQFFLVKARMSPLPSAPMRRLTLCAMLIAALFAGGCASRSLPRYEKPIARARVQSVRTTAYTHSEADHIQHGRMTACGTTLQCGAVRSAAADWSRWPAGTVFRIVETGEVYRVDDYGWALAGTNTIDLYKPSRAAMNAWGVRRVTIENLEWGSAERSLAILRGRSKYRHVRRAMRRNTCASSSSTRKCPPANGGMLTHRAMAGDAIHSAANGSASDQVPFP